jgi:ribosomal protein S18 acetylase RimI-like enzyme
MGAAGVATCFEGFSTFACQPLLNIHDVAVHPAHRGQGIGKQLLAGGSPGSCCCKLTLEVLEGNKVAQAAYRASGFAVMMIPRWAGPCSGKRSSEPQ